ncbi:hypothetical protein [Actinospica robiniae]|uniref:hypothetical protein n=1 Tax=Actinospica robiniae TaxID=304901 RepID=UPI000408E0D3|nr:hypothetical protein [Actinospica robiniae]
MGTLLVVVVAPVAALTLARRLVRHPAYAWVKDIAASVAVLVRLAYKLVRFLVLFVVGEVRSWKLSRSSAQ